MRTRIFSLAAMFLLASCTPHYDIIVAGGGTSACSAAIQAARSGASVLMICEHEWVGGMLTSAGVSAIDGNYNLRGGIFAEFTDSLATHYGGYDSLRTGWVSRIQYEPHVGERILENMIARQKEIKLIKSADITRIFQTDKGWKVQYGSMEQTAACHILIDCTELGYVAAMAGVDYEIGMDARNTTGEEAAPETANDIIQDLTYVAILKDYGPEADMTIPLPDDYDRNRYVNSCLNVLNTPIFDKGQKLWSPERMISYGRLPGGKYMINWPIEGNDFYANVIDSTPEQRQEAYRRAKNQTLGFIYFIQTELGMRNLGLADDEFPSADRLALMPYNRESRRIKGESFFTVNAAADPYSFEMPLYRSGIAVGDYAVDHHHFQHPDWKQLPRHIFAPIWAFTVPAGCLIPQHVDNLIVAEKSISVSNLMNGTTRLQPVVMGIGQAAGEMAAQAVSNRTQPRKLEIRKVQSALLESGCYIQPYRDVAVEDSAFKALQRIGSCGILRCRGEYVDWQNKCYIRAEDPLYWDELYLEDLYGIPFNHAHEQVDAASLKQLLQNIPLYRAIVDLPNNHLVTRKEAAIFIDSNLHPFENFSVDFDGNLR